MHPQLFLVLLLLGAVVLQYVYRRDRAAIGRQRAAMFDDCLSLFQEPRLVQDDVSLPVLTGRYKGYQVKVEPLADHIGYRKLPNLWLLVTVRGGIPYSGVFDFLVRPENIEFFSPSDSLPYRVPLPDAWPQYATLRTDRPAGMPPPELMNAHMHLFHDVRVKELLVTPQGVRIVYLADQARRAHYLVLRSSTFEKLRLAPAMLRDLLEEAVAVHRHLNEEAVDEIVRVG